MNEAGEITQLLQRGDKESLEKLLPIVYEELRRMSAGLFRLESRENHTLQPTALVHEAYLRLMGDSRDISWQNRAHFFGIAARSMRQILIGHAISRQADKRGGGQTLIALDEAVGLFQAQDIDLVSLHQALERLAENDARQAEIIELRFFGGLTIEETSEVIGISQATVKREWNMAKAWLYRELNK